MISDGGCTCPGDFSKAFGAGADFVMAGGMFASHYESGGEIVEINGKLFKQFYGIPDNPPTHNPSTHSPYPPTDHNHSPHPLTTPTVGQTVNSPSQSTISILYFS